MTVAKANTTHDRPGSLWIAGAVAHLHLPSLCLADYPPGIRRQELVSAFLAAIHLGATWDKELMYPSVR